MNRVPMLLSNKIPADSSEIQQIWETLCWEASLIPHLQCEEEDNLLKADRLQSTLFERPLQISFGKHPSKNFSGASPTVCQRR